MQCENNFCIYWVDGLCRLSTISLDVQGRCQACIFVDIGENILQQARNKLLNCYADEEATWK